MRERGVDIIMMVGPMKKKVITTGVICAIIPIIIMGVIGFFIYSNFNKEIETLKTKEINGKRYALANDVLANHVITESDLILAEVKEAYVPEDSFVYEEDIRDDEYMIVGRRMKVNAKANTVLSESMFYDEDKTPSIDLRLQEFNMITLPSDLVENDYIDVRVRFPSGEDYSVLVGKRVESYSNNTIYIKLNEDEILTIGSAIIEAYILDGTKLYANKYVDPANQLFEYNKVDYVARYNATVEDLIAIRKQEMADTYKESHPEMTDEQMESYKETLSVSADDINLAEVARLIGLAENEIQEIRNAIQTKNDKVLEGYRNKIVTSEKKIARTYPVKENVLNLIKSNPNILDEIKANFDTEAILAQRVLMASTTLDPNAENYDELVEAINERVNSEVQTQKEERVTYLRSLLNSTGSSVE